MKLIRKIKHCKRHKRNKKIAIFAEAMYLTSFKDGSMCFFVHPLVSEVIRFRYRLLPQENVISSPMEKSYFTFTIAPRDIVDFYKRDETKWLKEWCGIPLSKEGQEQLDKIPLSRFAQPELYLRDEWKVVPPKPTSQIREI